MHDQGRSRVAIFITRDGRRMPFIDWVGAAEMRSQRIALFPDNRMTPEDCNGDGPAMLSADEVLDRNLLEFLQG